jgi:hypothetical protein
MYCGVGLVVEHVLAKDETGVRFSYAAQNKKSFIFLLTFIRPLSTQKSLKN